MSEVLTEKHTSPQPLTALTDDEVLFRDNIRQFAEEAIRPRVREMDEKAVFERSIIDQFFQLGIMGIEIPVEYGGGGGTFFEACLAVEEISKVDASAGVIVDVQNTLSANAFLKWGKNNKELHDHHRREEHKWRALGCRGDHRKCPRDDRVHDPMRETADIDESNNSWPTVNSTPTKFQLFKMKQQNQRNPPQGINPMQKATEKKKGF